jgi:hypothetical protein
MAKQFRTREGDVTAVDTKTQLTTVGSDTSPGPLLVPKGMKYIVGVIVSAIQNMAAATGSSTFVRLEGPGMQNGPETLAAHAGGNAVATGGNFALNAKRLPVNFPVVEGNEIQIFGEMAGTDIGGTGVVVTLEFADALPQGEVEHKTITVEGDVTTVDTRTALLTQGSVTAPVMVVPQGYTRIDKIIAAAASEALADGKQTWFIRLGGNAVQGGEQVICLGSSGRIAVQAGSDAAPQAVAPTVLEDVQIPVNGGDTISVWAEGAGEDTGTGHVVVTLAFAK